MISKTRGVTAPARAPLAALALISLGALACGGGGGGGTPAPLPVGGSNAVPAPTGGGQVRADGGSNPDAPGSRGPVTTGSATARFCNTVVVSGGQSIEFTMSIGDPAIRFTAGSRTCVPPDGQACMGIPAGMQPYTFTAVNPADGQTLVIESGSMEIAAGEELFMLVGLDQTRQPSLLAGILDPVGTCNTITYADIPRLVGGGTDGGAPGGGPDASGADDPGSPVGFKRVGPVSAQPHSGRPALPDLRLESAQGLRMFDRR